MSIAQDAIAEKLVEPGTAREIRERAGMSQARIAAELDVWPNTVQRWETGVSRPRGGLRLRYARLLAEINDLQPAA
ncbi:hypothetical protein GCM10010458_36580 [Microbacterium luteolum]|uniref:Helix-turn-helix domain-containing protein n=1 Tax=Microbacterium luteolum TaxID=69367 RepID=A0ABY7XKA6_MICLT|nr:helix-turn-helix transcriptional regulator [Microbacterium luteolum]WDM42523.1 helix-turn-helix domain-containing protein [Microbacterium luteolum]